MQNSQQILDCSVIVIAVISFLIGLKGWSSAYDATLGNGQFKYRFDKARLPLYGRAVAILAVFSFGYSQLIAAQTSVAVVYGLLMTFFGGIGLLFTICYVSKHR